MPILNKLEKLRRLVFSSHRLLDSTQHILILSHMRSRSSALSHILGSHREILGYSELGLNYARPFAVQHARAKLLSELDCDRNINFFLDKVLQNEYELPIKLLKKSKIIILLRQPEDTLKSILSLGKLMNNQNMQSVEKAVDYYSARLDRLLSYAKNPDIDIFFVESDRLISDTSDLFYELQSWLGLSVTLENEYRVFDKTGEPGAGDTSSNLQTGKLVATPSHGPLDMAPELIEPVFAAYLELSEYLGRRASIVTLSPPH